MPSKIHIENLLSLLIRFIEMNRTVKSILKNNKDNIKNAEKGLCDMKLTAGVVTYIYGM